MKVNYWLEKLLCSFDVIVIGNQLGHNFSWFYPLLSIFIFLKGSLI